MGLSHFRSLFFLGVVACGRGPATSRIAATATTSAPAELRLAGLDEYRTNPRFLADRIYVYGHSKSRIAYLLEPADEACGCYRPEMVVQDLRSGEVIWKDSYDSGELDPKNTSQLKNVVDLWRAKGADWERHAAEQGIARETAVPLRAIPTGGTSIPRFELHVDHVDDTSPEGYEHLTSYRVDIVTSRGTTTIASSLSRETKLLGIDVLGVIPPNDNGSAPVVVLETKRGWESVPVHRLRIVGADLHTDLF